MRYFYHVVYEYLTDTLTQIGSVGFETSGPIDSEEKLKAIAEKIKDLQDLKHPPTITNFILLKLEETTA